MALFVALHPRAERDHVGEHPAVALGRQRAHQLAALFGRILAPAAGKQGPDEAALLRGPTGRR
jgi:hypothetical protein